MGYFDHIPDSVMQKAGLRVASAGDEVFQKSKANEKLNEEINSKRREIRNRYYDYDVEIIDGEARTSYGWKKIELSESYTFKEMVDKTRDVLDGFKETYKGDGEWKISPTYREEKYSVLEEKTKKITRSFCYRVIKKGSKKRIAEIEENMKKVKGGRDFDEWSSVGTEGGRERVKKSRKNEVIFRCISIVCLALFLFINITDFIPFLETPLVIGGGAILLAILYFFIIKETKKGIINNIYDVGLTIASHVCCIIGYLVLIIALVFFDFKVQFICTVTQMIIFIVWECILNRNYQKKYKYNYDDEAIQARKTYFKLQDELMSYIIKVK